MLLEVIIQTKPPQTGLSGDEKDLHRRRKVFGVNVIPLKPMKSFLQFVFESIQDTMLIILMIAAIASLGLGYYLHKEPEDGVVEGDGGLMV